MQSQWRATGSRLTQRRPFATIAETVDHAEHSEGKKYAEYAPLCVLAGMLVAGFGLGLQSIKQQLAYSPVVSVSKRRRESFYEVDNPDLVVDNADKFLNKSFLRKVAYVQQSNRILPDTSRPDPFLTPRTAETLKSVGIDTRVP